MGGGGVILPGRLILAEGENIAWVYKQNFTGGETLSLRCRRTQPRYSKGGLVRLQRRLAIATLSPCKQALGLNFNTSKLRYCPPFSQQLTSKSSNFQLPGHFNESNSRGIWLEVDEGGGF